MTINGVSTCTEAGTEKYERFQSGIGRRKRTLVQYDYRHTDGELFACVKPTLDECRTARNKYLMNRLQPGASFMSEYIIRTEK